MFSRRNILKVMFSGLFALPVLALPESRTPPVEKEFLALLTSDPGNIPAVQVLKNELGGVPVWTRSYPGFYRATLAGAFPLGRTAIQPILSMTPDSFVVYAVCNHPDYVEIIVADWNGNGVDDFMTRVPFLVRVF